MDGVSKAKTAAQMQRTHRKHNRFNQLIRSSCVCICPPSLCHDTISEKRDIMVVYEQEVKHERNLFLYSIEGYPLRKS